MRDDRILFKSEPTQERFNLPHQLGTNGHNVDDTLVINKHKLQQNDIVVFASDGLWDNVHDNELEIVWTNNNRAFDTFAVNLANDAKTHALNDAKLSPFMNN